MAKTSIRVVALSFVVGIMLIGTVVFLIPSNTQHVSRDSSPGSSSQKSSEDSKTAIFVDSTDDRRAYLQSMNTFVAEHPQDVKAGSGNMVENIDISQVPSQEVAIVQFDSRPLSQTAKSGYWSVSAAHNYKYCQTHGHAYLYYDLKENAEGKKKCMAVDGTTVLADPWCKVKAMLSANEDAKYNKIKLFVYMDSDAVLDRAYADKPLQTLLGSMQHKLAWNVLEKPTIFNQDGPCWWCDLVEGLGYKTCLNAGTVVWYRHERSKATLAAWWQAAMDEYAGNPMKRKFRTKWPWEQDRQMALFNRTPEHIQIASQPLQSHMDMQAGHKDWCLSHLARSGCYISHFCEGAHSKRKMKERYAFKDAVVPPVLYL